MKTLSRAEAAAFLKCDEDTVSRYVNTGELPAAKIGRAIVIMEDDLTTFLVGKIKQRTEARRSIDFNPTPRRGRRRFVLNLPEVAR